MSNGIYIILNKLNQIINYLSYFSICCLVAKLLKLMSNNVIYIVLDNF